MAAALLPDQRPRDSVRSVPRGRSRRPGRSAGLEVTSVSSVRSARARAAALRTALGLLAGLVLVFVFLRLVNVGAVYHRLTHLEIGFGLLCGVAFLGAYVVR